MFYPKGSVPGGHQQYCCPCAGLFDEAPYHTFGHSPPTFRTPCCSNTACPAHSQGRWGKWVWPRVHAGAAAAADGGGGGDMVSHGRQNGGRGCDDVLCAQRSAGGGGGDNGRGQVGVWPSGGAQAPWTGSETEEEEEEEEEIGGWGQKWGHDRSTTLLSSRLELQHRRVTHGGRHTSHHYPQTKGHVISCSWRGGGYRGGGCGEAREESPPAGGIWMAWVS